VTAPLAIAVTLVTAAIFSLLGIWHVRRRGLTLEDYTVSRDSTGAGAALATVVASVAGAWILFSPAEAATWSGLPGVVGYALGQAAPIAALAILGPRLRRLMPRGHSVAEYTRHRYGMPMYLLTLAIMLFYMFVFLAAEMTAIAQALRLVADIPLAWTALIVAVGTVAYTCYGGLRASMFTDAIQFALVVPLLLVTCTVALAALGGFGAALAPVAERAPHLLRPDHRAGLAFGATLVIAILAANLFHQGYWQRVYACRDERVLRRSYLWSALVTIPLVLIGGLFGLMAVGQGVPADQASVALFRVAMQALPAWAMLLVLVLALALVMSSMDTLLNGIASVVTVDLARFRPGIRLRGLLRSSRLLTVATAIPAVWIASQGHSVLYLFLLADLVCSAAAFPVFYGLYSRRLTGAGAVTSAVAGVIAGAAFFPRPDFAPWHDVAWLTVHPDFRFLASFAAALLVSAALALLADRLGARLAPERRYDFRRLADDVQLIGG